MLHQEIQTAVISVDSQNPSDELLLPAAACLRQGGLVAFPTETVYGLGANALDVRAVARIFSVKGRPGDNPLIVHIADLDQLPELTAQAPALAMLLFRAFSPGPLTLVLPRSARIPNRVTAGLDTVAIRLPSHPVARRLIALAGVPVAAPSANRSGRPSPTQAWHVLQDMDGRIPYVIDGGDCRFGLESTVVDVTGPVPIVLRPGSITAAAIRAVAGCVAGIGSDSGTDAGQPGQAAAQAAPRAPGMKYRHYAPRAAVIVAGGPDGAERLARMRQLMLEAAASAQRIGIFASRQLIDRLPGLTVAVQADLAADQLSALKTRNADFFSLAYGEEPDAAAAGKTLFAALRALDELDVDVILAEGLPDVGQGVAYMNRLRKAAGSQDRWPESDLPV